MKIPIKRVEPKAVTQTCSRSSIRFDDRGPQNQLQQRAGESVAVKQLKSLQGLANLSIAAARSPIQLAGQPGEFASQERLDDHYQKHCVENNDAGGDYGSAAEYEQAAIAITKSVEGKRNKGGGVSYYNDATNQYVVMNKPGGFIQTMYVCDKSKYTDGLAE